MGDEKMTLKEKLGFGSMRSEDELVAHDLAKAAQPKSRFDAAMSYIITNMLMHLVVPWINSCFEKYSEADFHGQMANNFDFIADWKANHEERFAKFLRTARVLRTRFSYDHIAIFAEIMKIFDKKGWKITPVEKTKLMCVILDLREMIYKD